MSRCRTKRQITLCPVEDPDKIVLWNYFLLYQIRQRVTARVIVVIIRILILCNFPIIVSVCWIIIILTDNFNTPIWFRRKINIIGHIVTLFSFSIFIVKGNFFPLLIKGWSSFYEIFFLISGTKLFCSRNVLYCYLLH